MSNNLIVIILCFIAQGRCIFNAPSNLVHNYSFWGAPTLKVGDFSALNFLTSTVLRVYPGGAPQLGKSTLPTCIALSSLPPSYPEAPPTMGRKWAQTQGGSARSDGPSPAVSPSLSTAAPPLRPGPEMRLERDTLAGRLSRRSGGSGRWRRRQLVSGDGEWWERVGVWASHRQKGSGLQSAG